MNFKVVLVSAILLAFCFDLHECRAVEEESSEGYIKMNVALDDMDKLGFEKDVNNANNEFARNNKERFFLNDILCVLVESGRAKRSEDRQERTLKCIKLTSSTSTTTAATTTAATTTATTTTAATTTTTTTTTTATTTTGSG